MPLVLPSFKRNPFLHDYYGPGTFPFSWQSLRAIAFLIQKKGLERIFISTIKSYLCSLKNRGVFPQS